MLINPNRCSRDLGFNISGAGRQSMTRGPQQYVGSRGGTKRISTVTPLSRTLHAKVRRSRGASGSLSGCLAFREVIRLAFIHCGVDVGMIIFLSAGESSSRLTDSCRERDYHLCATLNLDESRESFSEAGEPHRKLSPADNTPLIPSDTPSGF